MVGRKVKMNTIIKRPIITEKSLGNATTGVYTFEVDKAARKDIIVKEIERMFNVHVISARTVIMHGKTHRVGRRRTELKQSDWKKVFITVKKGERIDLFDVTAS
jgi:large subunit ribosomal protein L23